MSPLGIPSGANASHCVSQGQDIRSLLGSSPSVVPRQPQENVFPDRFKKLGDWHSWMELQRIPWYLHLEAEPVEAQVDTEVVVLQVPESPITGRASGMP